MLAVTASAQKRYNLGECRDMALAHNARIKMANNDALSAMQGKKEALANFFPSLSVGGGGMKANDYMIKMDMGPLKCVEVYHSFCLFLFVRLWVMLLLMC